MTTREPSLFIRLVVLIGAVLGLGAGILVTAAWYYASTAANEAYDRLLLGAALQIAENIAVEDGTAVPDLPTAPFEMLALSRQDRIFYRVVGVHGETVTGYDDLAIGGDLAQSHAGPLVLGGNYRGEPVRIAVVGRAFSDPDMSGWAHVLVAQTVLSRTALARELTLRAMLLVAAMSLLALGGVVFAVRYALSPLKRLEGALRQRDPNDLTALDVATPRELRPFVLAINHFMEKLRERMGLLQRFIADAAHQIRTPLTALSAQAELLSGTDMSDMDRQHMDRVRQRAGQLARLTNQLLSHAMVIHRTEAVAFGPVDVADVARLALREAVPASLDRDVLVSLEAPDQPVLILGDRISLREALANVIDNAVRHGAPSRLTVRIRREGTSAIVGVEDDGPGIPMERWEEVTTRFGSSSAVGRSGGLGFSIAAEVCKAHRGFLRFGTGRDGGFTVSLHFPLFEGQG